MGEGDVEATGGTAAAEPNVADGSVPDPPDHPGADVAGHVGNPGDPLDANADPSGYRALLFSDLRGYTNFVETRGDAEAAHLLQRYRIVVRDVIGRYTGAEIRTEGDSFYVVFASASAAVRAGLAIVAAARDASLREPRYTIDVGIGIHAGETTDTPEGPVGSAVNIAARICSQARADEILVSETVRGLVRTSVPVEFASRGRRQLKGVREPIMLFAVVGESVSGPGARTIPVRAGGGLGSRPLVAGAGVLLLVVVIAAAALLRPGSPLPGTSPDPGRPASAAAGSSVAGAGASTAANPSATAGVGAIASASNASAISSPRPSSSAFPTTVEQALLDHVPQAIAPHCARGTTSTGSLGGLAAIRCELLAEDADTVWYDQFVTRATAGERFDRLVHDAQVPTGLCSTTVTKAAGSWALGSGVAGQLLCYSDAGVAWIVWTYLDEPIIGQASRGDGNAAALYAWWKGVGPFLR